MKSKHYDVISFDTKRAQNMDMYLCAITAVMSGVSLAWLLCRNRTNFVNRDDVDAVAYVYDTLNKAVTVEE